MPRMVAVGMSNVDRFLLVIELLLCVAFAWSAVELIRMWRNKC